MFAASLLFCLHLRVEDALVARDLTPFARLDAAVRALPTPVARTVASVANGLAQFARSPLEKARAAYVWTTARVAYSYDRRDAAGAVRDLRGDCDAHAALFGALGKALGLEVRTVAGAIRFAVPPHATLMREAKEFAPGQWLVSHAWNSIRVEGRWGFVDTTLGSRSPQEGTALEDDYFLPDPNVLATDHVCEEAGTNVVETRRQLARTPIVRPLAWRLGIDPRDLELKDGQLALPWRKGLRVSLQTENGDLPDRALAQPNARGTEIRLCPSGAAAIAWLGLTVEGEWRPLAGYAVTGPSAKLLPRLTKDFFESGASLLGPFERDLEADRSVEIRLRAPGASAVVAFQGPNLVARFAKEGEDWVLKLSPSAGESLEIMASYAAPNRFQGLLTYEIRSPRFR